jgi:hypothetical protein
MFDIDFGNMFTGQKCISTVTEMMMRCKKVADAVIVVRNWFMNKFLFYLS